MNIANETMLWCLWDPMDPRPEHDPQISEGYLASMLGVDRIQLRAMYHDFLKHHGARCAMEVRLMQIGQDNAELATAVKDKIDAMFNNEPF